MLTIEFKTDRKYFQGADRTRRIVQMADYVIESISDKTGGQNCEASAKIVVDGKTIGFWALTKD